MTAPAPRPVVVTLPDGAQVELHHDVQGGRPMGLVLRGPGAWEAAQAMMAVMVARRPTPVLLGTERLLIHTFEVTEVRDAAQELCVRLITVPWVPRAPVRGRIA